MGEYSQVFAERDKGNQIVNTGEMYDAYKAKADNFDVPSLTIGEALRHGQPLFEDTNNVVPNEEEVRYVGTSTTEQGTIAK